MERLGSVKIEKDGSRWILGTNRNGKKKWIRDSTDKTVDFQYTIRPEANMPLYEVKVYNNNQTVNVYDLCGYDPCDKLLYQYHAHDLWCGTNYQGGKDAVMLIRVTKNRYIFVENGIYEFKTLDKYPITLFLAEDSGISGSWSSYAISASYVYLLRSKIAVPRSEFSDTLKWSSIFSQVYDEKKSKPLTMVLIDDPEKVVSEATTSAFTCCLM